MHHKEHYQDFDWYVVNVVASLRLLWQRMQVKKGSNITLSTGKNNDLCRLNVCS
jgi:hypothetical protein